MTHLLIERLKVSFSLYEDLVSFLDESALSLELADLPSNSIGQQLWCVVGARESYTRAIENGGWAGFSCSLTREQIAVKAEVLGALKRSSETAIKVLSGIGQPAEAQLRLAMQLLEHESQHHGQLIRYLYGLKLGVPKGLKERYHLE